MLVIPEYFVQHTHTYFETDAATDWLARLPAILTDCAQQWHITPGPPMAGLSYHYVAPAINSKGDTVILKVHAPSPFSEFVHESTALRLFDGRGTARLLACEPDHKAMLLEALQPGTQLRTLDDDEQATLIACRVMQQLWRPVPPDHPFPSIQDWGRGFARLRQRYNGGHGPFPPRLLAEAETLFAELCTSMTTPVLLHGDLHHDNILAAERSPWLAIDPKGLIGEPAYEVGALLRNPFPQLFQYPQPGRVLARRVDQFSAELGLDRARVRGWGLAQAVLACWWTVEDSGQMWEEALTCAELLAAITT
jgi:streptomycin 6-kinase